LLVVVVPRDGGGGGGDDDDDTNLQNPTFQIPNVMYPSSWGRNTSMTIWRSWILIDWFTDYYGIYLEQMALEVYDVAVIRVYSDNICQCLLQTQSGHKKQSQQ
jgi:hypothetical protein